MASRAPSAARLGSFCRPLGLLLPPAWAPSAARFADESTTLGLGLFGAALHKNPKSAFVVGLGAGQTAGYLAEIETIEKVEVVELEEDVVEFAELCSDVNANVLHHSKISSPLLTLVER
ncbi:MAG: hypothetical protein GY822_21515 [Deltaproteobacteria bacterium]|nr:hypothetical protein [Deltaproteobacteria bacterium]